MFRKSKLKNGMTLVTERLPQFQSLALGVWVNAGSRHERPIEAGMSHFLEHMMFKGTSRRSALDIAREVDQAGGEFNAFTTREYTCFHILLLSRDLKLGVDILCDVMTNSLFASDEIERERRVILQEIAMVEDNPEELIYDLFFSQSLSRHALGKPILGSRKTVSNFTRDQVFDFFKRHYVPRDMVISVAGNVDHRKVEALFNDEFSRPGSRKLSSAKNIKRYNTSRPKIAAGAKFATSAFEQEHLIIGFPGVTTADKERFAALLLNVYLGGGMSSSLFQEIREKRGLAYTVYSSLSPYSDCGLFSVYVATNPKEVATCLEVTGREIKKLREQKLDFQTVKTLKDNLRGTILINSDSVESRMMSIARNEMFFKKYYSVQQIAHLIEQVSAEDMQRLAKKIFLPEKLIVTGLGPLKNGSELIQKLKATLK